MQSDGIRIGDQPAFTLDIGRHLLIAMQKVVGSSPISRLREARSWEAVAQTRRNSFGLERWDELP
jgi:hypothetical protein